MEIADNSWEAKVLEYLRNPKYRELRIKFNISEIVVKCQGRNLINKSGIKMVRLEHSMKGSDIMIATPVTNNVP